MKNIKDQVYNALLSVTENVSDSYPTAWAEDFTIQITEEENSVYERTDNREQKARLRYRIDIFDRRSTSQAAILVDDAISALGLVRTSCQDVTDPSGMKHKLMRYEGIIDMDSEIVFWDR